MVKRSKGVKFTVLSSVFFASLSLLIILILLMTVLVYNKFAKVQKSVDEFISCESSSQAISQASNLLTERAQLYIMTHNPIYAQEYVNEKFILHSKETALEEINHIKYKNFARYKQLQIAMEHADSLSQIELYAMRLAYQAELLENPGNTDIPEQIRSIELRSSDIRQTAQEQQALAQKTIFDEGYLVYKNRVSENCDTIISEIKGTLFQEVNTNSQNLKRHLFLSNFFIIILVLTIITFFAVMIKTVLHPLVSYIHSIKNNEKIQAEGSFELQLLAQNYNDANEDSENDSLTSILNRRAFTKLCQDSEKNKEPLGLLLVDSDDFKRINDTYGHAVGDVVLKAIAEELIDFYGNIGKPARIGGDEFAVLFPGYSKTLLPSIMVNFNKINEHLSSLIGIKNASISGGFSFSDEGYSKTLYEQADSALYKVKENGKHDLEIFSL